MSHKIDFRSASSAAIIAALGQRLDEIRLNRNIPQAELAAEAGVSRSTLTRLADGRPVSLDSFVRVMQALQLSDHLAALLPDPRVRPVDRVRLSGSERQRASGKRSPPASSPWTWGDERGDGREGES
ncbi:MAG: helix-turn-helix transcriptional regulator [Halieaceae bacterium]|jgi:transcriptional regulator with XRE-family HTH domain|nr:helix-turn-helix transcriptional regulator [Halieaceae bacterium]